MKERASKEKTKSEIKSALKRRDGMSAQDIANHLDMYKSYISKLLKGMRESGEVFASGKPTGYRYHITKEQAEAISIFIPVCTPCNKSPTAGRPSVVDDYRANSQVYRFDKLQAAARANHG